MVSERTVERLTVDRRIEKYRAFAKPFSVFFINSYKSNSYVIKSILHLRDMRL
jgi:hypothetical protein